MRAPLYLVEQGSKLAREGRRVVVVKDGETLAQIAVLQISQVIVYGNIQITTPALRLLLDEGVEVVLLSETGRFYGRVVGAPGGAGARRVAQALRSRDAAFTLALAQRLVAGKLHNMKVFLQRYARRMDAPEVAVAAEALNKWQARCGRTTTLPSLLGAEGQGAALYFGVWKSLLKPPFTFAKRIRRPPTDPVNVLLSFGYTLLAQNVLGAVLAAGLDPYIGFLHQLEYNRPALALDLMEEFRPLVVDSVTLRCLNNGIVTPDDFVAGDEERPLILGQEGIKRFVRELESRLTQPFKHPVSGEQVTYRRLFLLQAYAIARSLEDESGATLYRPFAAR